MAAKKSPASKAGQREIQQNNGAGTLARYKRRWLAIERAYNDRELTNVDLNVFIAIVIRMDADFECYPSLTTIAADARVRRASASQSVSRLVTRGHLIRESGKGTDTNTYRLPTPSSSAIATTSGSPTATTSTSSSAPSGARSSAPSGSPIATENPILKRTLLEENPIKENQNDVLLTQIKKLGGDRNTLHVGGSACIPIR